jgi:phosphoglycerol transferase MdoB-like AlkP superfamily enzyme
MKKRLTLFLGYFLFWYLFFVTGRLLFLIYEFRLTKNLSISEIANTFIFGSKLDFSITGYLLILPGLFFIVTSFTNGKLLSYLLNIYTYLFIFIIGLLIVADLELYRNWGFRMDATPIMYLKTPKEATGSTKAGVAITLFLTWIVFASVNCYLYFKFIGKKLKLLESSNWITSLVFLLLTVALILPIRGSLGVSPINAGFVYFSKTNVFANHAAINVAWNFAEAVSTMEKIKPYDLVEKSTAEKVFKENYFDNGSTLNLLNTDRPNVIILILESFTNKIIEPLGGLKGITPNFTQFAKQGVLFRNCYATGDRTDKGIISVLNGYPGHPKLAIVNFPKKMENLPYLSSDLKKLGYFTGFVFGYNPDYANFRAYVNNSGYEKFVSKADFKASECNAKWGVHDHIVLNRLLDECNQAKTPFFIAFASLSSHEPFDVPAKTVIQGKEEKYLYLNSAHYADNSLGEFIMKAQKTSWWKNTLVVMIADHGTRHPDLSPPYNPVNSHIPMLWMGGAVAKADTVISTYCTQSDLAYTILRQLGVNNTDYKFSQNFLSTEAPAFGFYVFNNGFGFLKKGKLMVYDCAANKMIMQNGLPDEEFVLQGKSYFQVLTDDVIKR